MKKLFLACFSSLALMCGGHETATSETAAPVETTAAAAPTEPTAPIDFTGADLDLYERGITHEIAIVMAARAKAASAATPAERAKAAQEEWEDQSIPAAAKAAGIPEDRYRSTRKAVHQVFETLNFQGKLDGPLEMDMEHASEEAKARLAKDPFDALTPSAAAALRARMDRLSKPWIDYMRLVAVNG